MRNSMKFLSIIMVMITMILAACAQDNTSNNGSSNSGSTSTGVVGKWRQSVGGHDIVKFDFRADGYIYDVDDGTKVGGWQGNDIEGYLDLFGGGKLYDEDKYFDYSISGNNMTLSAQDDNEKLYLTRM